MNDVALLERYRDGGIAVYDGLIQSFKESKAILGNVSMNLEDIAKVLDLSRSGFTARMNKYVEIAQNESGEAVYERICRYGR